MSINHLVNPNQNPKYDLYVNNINAKKAILEEPIDTLAFKCQNGDVVNLSSLPDQGIGGYRLTSDGDGTVSWTAGAGSSGVDYNGNPVTQINKIAIYGATNGKLIKDSTLSDTDILNKNGDTMNGNLDIGNNNIENVNTARVNVFEANPSIDPFSVGFNADNISFNSINLTCNGLPAQEVTWRFTRQGVNYGEFGTEPNTFYFGNFNNPAVNTEIRGANNEKLVIDDSTLTPECRLENLNLNMNNSDIDNVSIVDTGVINTNTITSSLPDIDVIANIDMNNGNILNANDVYVDRLFSTAPATEIQVENNLRMRNNDIVDVNTIDVNTTITTPNIDTDTIQTSTSGKVLFNNDIDLFNNDILSSGNIKTTSFSSTDIKTNDIDVNANLDFDNVFEIKGVTNVQTTDLNTDTLTSNTPNTEIKLGANTDLNLDGNNIIGLDLINGIQPSGGVYSNPTSNNYAGATAETDILTGTEYGSKTIPADNFVAGSLYSLKIGGEFDATNNDVFTIRVVSNFNTVNEAEFVNIPITITDTNLTNRYYELEIDFAVRTIGDAGVASILTNGSFDYYNTNNLKKGTGINNLNNTTFNTEIDNTLSVTYATTEASVDFTCDIATITKFY